MKKIITVVGLSCSLFAAQAQEEITLAEKNTQRIEAIEHSLSFLKGFQLSGYVQGQWQWAESKGAKAFADGGSFSKESDNRFAVRRGRIKLTYTAGIAQVVFQPDFTEKGVSIKDAYLKLTSKSKVFGGQLGVFDRPFGYEISYSSSLRESPERSRIFLSLFPGERETGAMVMLKGTGSFSDFTLNAGLFNGNGIGVDTDSRKDFIGRLAWLKQNAGNQVGAAFSYYNGSIKNPVDSQYEYEKGRGFVVKTIEKGSFEKREYFGFAAQYLQQSAIGTTHIRAEYLFGKQPGTLQSNANPGGSSFGAGTLPLHLRNFSGYYIILVQDIGQTKHSLVAKFDYYDPNTKISSHDIGRLNNTGEGDVAYSTIGVGYLYRMNANVRLMAYYNMIKNENCSSLEGFEKRIEQNVFTARVQVRF